MKILDFAPYIYDKGHPEFEKNKTGFGIMVNDICKKVSEKCDVSLLTHAITNGYDTGCFKVLAHRKKDIIKDFLYLFPAIVFALSKKKPSIKMRIRYVYYYLTLGSFKRYYKSLKPDVVHIHGVTVSTQPIIKYCLKKNIPYVVTLHGMISDLKWGNVSEADKLSEQYAFSKSPYVTVIGTGIKDRLCKLTNRKAENVFVVSNGTDTKKTAETEINIREKYGISENRKIFLSVGNISPWKNQIQTVRALGSLSEEERKKVFFVFAGEDHTQGEFDKEIEKQGVRDCVCKAGFIESSEISAYYEQSDFVVLASIEEGFGLSIIEGYSKGLPGIMFSDVDAAHDLYDEKALILVEERSDRALSDAFFDAIDRNWDREYIKNFAENFSLDKMSDKYISVYERVIEDFAKQ